MTETEILAKIENYMKKNNLRQWELARKLGIPEATLNRWLRRKTSISNAYIVILKKEGVI
jgi:plasmid maintenance system antidote protein VapI